MNTYILPFANISSDPSVWNEVVRARSISEAKDKIMREITEDWDLDVPTDWGDFKDILFKENVIVGDIQDIEEL